MNPDVSEALLSQAFRHTIGGNNSLGSLSPPEMEMNVKVIQSFLLIDAEHDGWEDLIHAAEKN